MPQINLWNKDFSLVFVSNLLLFFSFYLLLPIMPFYVIDQLKADQSIAGVILSLYTVAALVIRPFSGYMVDRFSRKPLYFICYFLFSAVFAGYLVTATLASLVVLRILHGLSFGISTVSGNTVAIDVMPSERRGEGIGYFGMAGSIAMALGPMAGLFLYNSYSFTVIFATSLLVSLCGLLCIVFVKAPKMPISTTTEVLSLNRFVLLKGLSIAPVLFAVTIGYGVLTNYIGLYSVSLSLNKHAAGLFFTLLALGIIGARLLSAKIINKGQLSLVTYIGLTALIVAYTILILCPNMVGFYLTALFLGLGLGYIMPAFQTMFINLAEHNQRGTANSTYFTAMDLGIGMGIACGGYMIKHYGFTSLYGVCLFAIVVGSLFFWKYAHPYFTKNKLR